MKTAKELANELRRAPYVLHRVAVTDALDRLARIDAATTEDVKAIQERHHYLETVPSAAETRTEAHRHRETLLAVVAKQEADAKRYTAMYADEVSRQVGLKVEAQNEVSRLKSALAAYEKPMDGFFADAYRRAKRDKETDFACMLGTVAHRDRETLLSALGRERAEKEALSGLVLAYRAADCPFGRPALIERLEREHGHLAKEAGK